MSFFLKILTFSSQIFPSFEPIFSYFTRITFYLIILDFIAKFLSQNVQVLSVCSNFVLNISTFYLIMLTFYPKTLTHCGFRSSIITKYSQVIKPESLWNQKWNLSLFLFINFIFVAVWAFLWEDFNLIFWTCFFSLKLIKPQTKHLKDKRWIKDFWVWSVWTLREAEEKLKWTCSFWSSSSFFFKYPTTLIMTVLIHIKVLELFLRVVWTRVGPDVQDVYSGLSQRAAVQRRSGARSEESAVFT